MKLIAITGGIGSGKSVMAHLVQVMGYQVYDCDSRAKVLMTSNEEVRNLLTKEFGRETYLEDGSLNRQHLSAMAFGNAETLARLNAIVHPATARDMMQWAETLAGKGADVAFIETALLRTAGLDKLVDEVWHVTAPTDIRIKRVIARSGLTSQQVRDRIASQTIEEEAAPDENVIVNDDTSAVLPQVIHLLNKKQ